MVNNKMTVLKIVPLFLTFCVSTRGNGPLFFICADSQSNTVPCGTNEVIDIIDARVANLDGIGVNVPCGQFSDSGLILNSNERFCKQDLPFLRCHGQQNCFFNGSVAEVWLKGCEQGRKSDVLYVEYKCHSFDPTQTISLPSTSFISSDTFDVISPGFPDVTPNVDYDVTCNLTPKENISEKIQINVEYKLMEFKDMDGSAMNTCLEELVLNGGKTLCYGGDPREKRNNDGGSSLYPSDWTLRYKSDGSKREKIWIRIKVTTENNSPVVMNVSCTDHQATTTAASPTTLGPEEIKSAKDKDNMKWMIIGAAAGGGFLILLIIIVIVVVCFRQKKRREDEKPALTEPSAPPAENDYSIAGAVNVSSKAPNSGKGGKAPKSGKKKKASKDAKRGTSTGYADVVCGPVYAQVNKDSKRSKGDRHSETIMQENSELYERDLRGKVNAALSEETVMRENNTLYASASPRQPNNNWLITAQGQEDQPYDQVL